MAIRDVPLSASRNILLARLSAADRAMLAPHASEIAAPSGCALLQAHMPLDAIYFPDAITISVEESLTAGGHVEVAIVGREGLLGWPALLGSGSSPQTAFVRSRGGTVLRIAAEPLRSACRRSPSLATTLLQFVHVMMIQMSWTIASHLQHSLDRRVARWLLMRHDRVGGDVLLCHHDEIARCLSVRRASVTDQLHLIEGERLVRCHRGRVIVRDRARLEDFAGDAYGQAESHYRRLIAPFGKSAPGVGAH